MSSFILKGKLQYFRPYVRDDISDKYALTLSNLDDYPENAQILKQYNLYVPKEREGWGTWVQCRNNESEPVVVDSKKNPIPRDVLFGNGTVARVAVNSYDVTKGPARGHTGLVHAKVQILELVPYTSGVVDLDEEEGGFTVDSLPPRRDADNVSDIDFNNDPLDDEVPF